MPKLNDLSRSLTVLKGDSTLIAVIEMSQSSCSLPALCLASSDSR
jgi:hypothetical protein